MSATVPDTAASERGALVASSYRQLAEIYHDLLSRDQLDQVLERLVKTVTHLIPVASILIAEAQTEQRLLKPIVAEGGWPDGFLDGDDDRAKDRLARLLGRDLAYGWTDEGPSKPFAPQHTWHA